MKPIGPIYHLISIFEGCSARLFPGIVAVVVLKLLPIDFLKVLVESCVQLQMHRLIMAARVIIIVSLNAKKPFGAAIKNWRNKLGFSQEKLAERSGLHRTYISDIERGTRNVSLESIEKLADALDLPLVTLFADVGEPGGEPTPVRHLSADEMVDILLVEDDANDVTLTLETLREAKVANRIHVVRDGASALDFLFCLGQYAHRHPNDLPEMVLLDLNLPRMNGIEVLRHIRADVRTRSLSVVVLTSSNRDRDIQASKKLGADTYIVKPVDFQSLSLVTPQLSLRWALLKPTPALHT
jgi:CheY-like chemotaxis protein